MPQRKSKHTAGEVLSSKGRAEPIAIIGMSGRFPGANDVDQLWTNLAHGVESIAILTQEEMRAAGVDDTTIVILLGHTVWAFQGE